VTAILAHPRPVGRFLLLLGAAYVGLASATVAPSVVKLAPAKVCQCPCCKGGKGTCGLMCLTMAK